MIKPETLLPRFRKFDEYISILQKLREYSKQEFLANAERYGSAERFLQLAIETLNDIGGHIIADEGYGTIDTYSDVPERLAENGVIDEEMKELWITMTGFRNVLVHDYVELDRERVYAILQDKLDDLVAIKRKLTELL